MDTLCNLRSTGSSWWRHFKFKCKDCSGLHPSIFIMELQVWVAIWKVNVVPSPPEVVEEWQGFTPPLLCKKTFGRFRLTPLRWSFNFAAPKESSYAFATTTHVPGWAAQTLQVWVRAAPVPKATVHNERGLPWLGSNPNFHLRVCNRTRSSRHGPLDHGNTEQWRALKPITPLRPLHVSELGSLKFEPSLLAISLSSSGGWSRCCLILVPLVWNCVLLNSYSMFSL